MKLPAVVLVALVLGAGSVSAQNGAGSHTDYKAEAEAYARDFLNRFNSDPALLEALRAAGEVHRRLGWEEAQALDRRWRDERADDIADGVVQAVRGGELSKWLAATMAKAPGGAVSEISIMDRLGWNVGLTGDSADYFQGDEARWQTVITGDAQTAVVSELEDLGGQGPALALVSLPLMDSERVIGVATIGVDVRKLN